MLYLTRDLIDYNYRHKKVYSQIPNKGSIGVWARLPRIQSWESFGSELLLPARTLERPA
jgi:hypothetical protein